MKKIILITISVLLLAVVGIYLKDKEQMDAFPHILPSYYAKEYCSCRFVTNNEPEFCANYAELFLPISSFSVDNDKKLVSVKGMGKWASAQWISTKQGCRLL